MEEFLHRYLLAALESCQPFMRSRACWIYGVFSDAEFKDKKHIKKMIVGLFKNMCSDQPLPVRFEAARAIQRHLESDN